MKILFDHSSPFLLAHGGFEIQIEQTKRALEQVKVEVDYIRWWDAAQTGEIIHYFGRPTPSYVERAHQKRIKIVMCDLLTGTGSRSRLQLRTQKAATQLARRLLPNAYLNRLAWDSYKMVDACVALTKWEAELMHRMFDASRNRIHVIPNGVEEVFLNSTSRDRGEWLVCTATITERKRVVELAKAAIEARTPLWIIGRPYSESDPYFQNFIQLCRANSDVLRYEGALEDRVQLAGAYRCARGFVLLSAMESLSLSANEAAACQCALLLSDLPWARSVFGESANYCPVTRQTNVTARALRTFYDEAKSVPPAPLPKTWIEVAEQLKTLYQAVLALPAPARASA